MKRLLLTLAECVIGAAADLPRKATNIPIALPDGTRVNISAYRGKVVCLAFILTS